MWGWTGFHRLCYTCLHITFRRKHKSVMGFLFCRTFAQKRFNWTEKNSWHNVSSSSRDQRRKDDFWMKTEVQELASQCLRKLMKDCGKSTRIWGIKNKNQFKTLAPRGSKFRLCSKLIWKNTQHRNMLIIKANRIIAFAWIPGGYAL